MSQERDKNKVHESGAQAEFSPADQLSRAEEGSGFARRDFMRMLGFSVGATALAGCTAGREHGVMPYLIRPEEVTPGKPYWYASVCGACPAGCGILVKARDGRPIKLEGNPEHPISRGGLCAVGQASVLGLYDSKRLRNPLVSGQPAAWSQVDQEIRDSLESIQATGGRVRFLTDSVTGPAERRSIQGFLSRFGDSRHVTYDPISVSAIAEAHGETHGIRALPRFNFDRAQVVLGIEADFLGGWISPVEHSAGYRVGRSFDEGGNRFSHHIQIESRMSLTGSNADRRIAVAPGTAAIILAHLADELARREGEATPWRSLPSSPVAREVITRTADRLAGAPRGTTLVVCGTNDLDAQRMTGYINHLLGNYGEGSSSGTIDLDAASSQKLGDDAELSRLLEEIEAGNVDALFIRGGNPVYDLPGGEQLARSLEKVKLVVSFAEIENETAAHAHYVCPEPHFLESWGDAEPIAGSISVRQPAIRPIGSTRPLLESLASWSGLPESSYENMRAFWQSEVYPRSEAGGSFNEFWNRTLHDGFAEVRFPVGAAGAFDVSRVPGPEEWLEPESGEMLLDLHPSGVVLDGRHAHNPWLQELPDPVSKTVWDNHAAIAPSVAANLGITTGDVIRITPSEGGKESLEIPALVQPGQHHRAVAVALGYGRAGTDRFTNIGPSWWEGRPTVEAGSMVGVSAAPFLAWVNSGITYSGRRIRIEKTGRRHELASTQDHHSLFVPKGLAAEDKRRRPIAQETTLAAWKEDPHAGSHAHHDLVSLWPDHPKSPHHWGMAIDLTACTGCSACVIACQSENNIPVVGKDEVSRSREMHWMRIDRYYGDDEQDVDVIHMPMMCQHCDNAPCETVCPVQATAQSAEGLNQQIYNRCIGTRYCANNCPYKVRRFNWFEYPREDRLQNLALNPEVTVRSRGVMEKCSLCVQRIQDGKAEAKRAGRPLMDGDIQPACAQSCPAQAIVFGDMNDPESGLSRQKKDPRHFAVLPETGVKPVVGYLTLVRNREDEKGGASHA
jgi:Fe-S-cluster-containing dehydrogenase component/anaerobic selenocysteine-containing dehydrogenase